MDFISILTTAALSSLITLSVALVAGRIELGRMKRDVSPMIDALIIEKVTAFLKLLHEKPEMFIPITTGLMGDLQKIVKLPDLNVAGQQVTGEGLQALIPMLPRKWRGPATIASMFMGGNGGEKKSESKSTPFG